MWDVYTMEYSSAIKKKVIMPLHQHRDYHTKQSKSERERQISYDITYMWNLKSDTKKLTYKTETNSQIQKAMLWLPKGVMKEQER